MNLRQISTIKDMPIMDLETGDALGQIVSWAIHPRDQRIVAWLLGKQKLFQAPLAVVTADVAEYGPHMVVVRDRQVLIKPDEVVGLPELITNKMVVVGFRAVTTQGRPLGVVTDLVFDTIGSQIVKYYVRPHAMAGFLQPDLVLPANQVSQIQPDQVVFADDVTPISVATPQKQAQTI